MVFEARLSSEGGEPAAGDHQDLPLPHWSQVAAKIYSRSPSAEDAFRNELRVLSCIHHPNIVRLRGYFEAEDTYGLLLEFLSGITLAAAFEEIWRAQEFELIEYIAAACISALAHIHREIRPGIIHGDLSPENIYLCRDGSIKLLDFGATSMAWFAPFGKLAYLAPEQLRLQGATFSSDLYALACILFELLAGRRLERQNLYSEMKFLANQSKRGPDFFFLAIRSCLAPSSLDRPRDAAQLLRSLEPLLAEKDQQWRRKKLAALVEMIIGSAASTS